MIPSLSHDYTLLTRIKPFYLRHILNPTALRHATGRQGRPKRPRALCPAQALAVIRPEALALHAAEVMIHG